jgi:micrococcal nuclease
MVELLNSSDYSVERHRRDKYGRTLVIMRINDVNVGDILISGHLARKWPDGDESWCKN